MVNHPSSPTSAARSSTPGLTFVERRSPGSNPSSSPHPKIPRKSSPNSNPSRTSRHPSQQSTVTQTSKHQPSVASTSSHRPPPWLDTTRNSNNSPSTSNETIQVSRTVSTWGSTTISRIGSPTNLLPRLSKN